MKLRTTSEKLLALPAILAVLCLPIIVEAAQVSEPPPAKVEANKQESATWLLAGREGECAPLSLLAKRGPAYAEVKSPADLAEKLRANGHKADVKEFKAGTRPAVEVRAQLADIHVMSERKNFATSGRPPPRKNSA